MNNIYLCKPGGRMLGILNGIDENSATLKQSVSDPWEISFDVYRYVANGDEMIETDYYSSVNEMMELYLTGDDADVFFSIDEEPQISGDGKTEKKTIHAHSIETEMSSKFLKAFKINCGTKDSQEYLLGYYDNDGNFRNLNLNPYTELPIDYIVVKNDYADQLQEVYDYLRTADLQVDPANGIIRNSTYYDYLIDIYSRFPRICSDVYYNDAGESVCDVYLRVIENLESPYGYDIKVGLDGNTESYTQEYFINGIFNLIKYYKEYGDQLSLIDLAIQKAHAAGWTVGNVPDSIKNKKFTFNVDNKDILSFFMTECTSAMKVLFDFDRHNRKVEIIDIANEDEVRDTGVLLTFRNLLNSVDVHSSSSDGIRTKYVPKGANNLGILYANFGENYILNMDWLMTRKTEYNDLQYVDDHLAEEWYRWIKSRENDPYSFDVQMATLVYLVSNYFRNNNDRYSSMEIEETDYEQKITMYRYNGMVEQSVNYTNRREFTEDVAPSFRINNYIIHDNKYMWKCKKYLIGTAKSIFEFKYVGDIADSTSSHHTDAMNVVNNATKHYVCASRREAYMELTKLYNQCMIDIDAELNRMPNDGVFIDYTTFKFDELNVAYKAYVNALATLITLYKNDVGAVTFTAEDINYYDPVDEDLHAYDALGHECTSIKDTFYWLDYQCYKYTILPNVLNALTMYVQTDEMVEQEGHYMKCILNPNSPIQYDKDKEEWLQSPDGFNTQYTGDTKRVTENMSDAFLYQMDLYGVVELKAKQTAWRDCAATLYKPGFILDKNGNVVDPIPYGDVYTTNTPDDTGWNKLSDAQKEEFTNKDAFIRKLEEYLDYASTYERKNKLTWNTYEKNTKGVIAMAQDEIDMLQPGIDDMYDRQDYLQGIRKDIANEVMIDNWSGFTDYELRLLYEMMRESDYSNDNILITNLDDIVTTVDAQEALYQDATVALSEASHPQLEFQVGLDNLFAIEEFKPLVEQTKLLNYIRISMGLHEDRFEKLRIISIEKNPLIPTKDLKLEFSNMTYSLQKMSDLAALFKGSSGGSSSGGSSSGGGGGGTYGSNDAEIQIANNMLNALLKSKTATSGMANVVLGQLSNNSDYASLMAQSGLFQKLEAGDLKVSGDCVTDHIRSSNYNAVTREGSNLELKDGTMSYADGKITYLDEEIPGSSGTRKVLRIDSDVVFTSQTEDDMTGEQMMTQIKTMPEAITFEVAKANASYSGPYVPTNSNAPASLWTGEMDQHINNTFYNTNTSSDTYTWKRKAGDDGILINMTYQTEAVGRDYVQILYEDDLGGLQESVRFGGVTTNTIDIFVPASRFYVYWHTDTSLNNYYGFKINSVAYASAGIGSFSPVATLPTTITDYVDSHSLPESPHNPYNNNTDKLYYVNSNIDTGSYSWELSITDDNLISRINLTDDSATIQAKKINFVIGDSSTDPSANQNGIRVYDSSQNLVGKWDTNEFAVGNVHHLYSNGNFSLGNGALMYTPSDHQYVYLNNNQSLRYNDMPTIGDVYIYESQIMIIPDESSGNELSEEPIEPEYIDVHGFLMKDKSTGKYYRANITTHSSITISSGSIMQCPYYTIFNVSFTVSSNIGELQTLFSGLPKDVGLYHGCAFRKGSTSTFPFFITYLGDSGSNYSRLKNDVSFPANSNAYILSAVYPSYLGKISRTEFILPSGDVADLDNL